MDITTRLALQSQATRLTGRVPGGGDRTEQGYDLLRLAVSTTNYTRCPLRNQTQTTIRRPRGADFHIELIPLHSPLLRESLLVSFPPLNNMFKFGGSSCLSSALRRSSHTDCTSAVPKSFNIAKIIINYPSASKGLSPWTRRSAK